MSALIIKKRARRALAAGKVSSIGIAPHGIGGIEGHAPCYMFTLGEIRVFLSDAELCDLITAWRAFAKSEGMSMFSYIPEGEPTIDGNALTTRHSEYIRTVRNSIIHGTSVESARDRIKSAEREYASWFSERGVKLEFPS